MPSAWTEDRIETLKKLWSEGLSCSQVGARLGVSRNAVIGKIHRLRLPVSSRNPAKKLSRSKATRKYKSHGLKFGTNKAAPSLPILPTLPDIAPSEFDVARKGLMDLEPGDCRWPKGDPMDADFGFCSLPKHMGSSYCPTHTARSMSAPVKVGRRSNDNPTPSETRTEDAAVPA